MIDPTERTLIGLGIENYQRHDNGIYFVPGHIDLSGKKLTALPDLSRVHVGGSFQCNNNRLTTLRGAPISVSARFACYNNQLTTFIGGPTAVGWDIICYNNQLTSLEGVPFKFNQLQSDFGTFDSYADIPPDLLISPETRARQALEGLNRVIANGSSAQSPIKLLPQKIKVLRKGP